MSSDPDSAETVAMPSASTSTPRPGGGGQRFAPGALLASRYRIISRLGVGGMGEVFRADDIVLGQEVALKFLPASAKGNLNLLTRFYDEVRIARQISHAHVCRVYDIGEVEGQPYLSMEYIDGEDLASLLRRIGRLPSDKGLELARKICAGVAAAHGKGVLHRDLKPHNIMIDARGEPRITDFGLAGVASELAGDEVRNGTPAYMAPEQLTGSSVSVQSDIYALGLVFYEMFTGKLPHKADTVAEVLRLRQESHITNPSTLVSDLDPAVERTILRCLEADPKQRPSTALSLAASLPGGDPLTAALAAGETPSPEMVAASGADGALAPKTALTALAGIATGLIVFAAFVPRLQMLNYMPMENPPEVITAKARDIVRGLGYTTPPVDSVLGILNRTDSYFGHLREKISDRERWEEILAAPPAPVSYWYRQGPVPLRPFGDSAGGVVTRWDPPLNLTGSIYAEIDLDGRLLQFEAVPPQRTETPAKPQEPDWSKLFAAAKLDPAQFTPATPQWVPLSAADTRAAWTGTYPGAAKLPVRIETAAFDGRPVYFEVIWPWTTPGREPGSQKPNPVQVWTNRIVTVVLLTMLLGACYLAWFNWKARRGDARGAFRVGAVIAILSFIAWALKAHHVSDVDNESAMFGTALSDAVFNLAIYWVAYLALEPWVRRHWPQALVTWSRILQGRWRDPAVGRDVLFGVLLGVVYLMIFLGFTIWVEKSRQGEIGSFYSYPNLLGLRRVAGAFVEQMQSAVSSGLIFFLLLFLLRAVLRKQWLAGGVFVIVWTLPHFAQTEVAWYVIAVFYACIYSTLVLVMMRFGFFALVVTLLVIDGTANFFVTADFGAWYGLSSWLVLAAVGGLGVWGFRQSLAGRPLFTGAVLEK